jgi:hypothetical protein
MRNSADPKRQEWARDVMSKSYNMGGPPYREGTPEARAHFNEAMSVVDPAFRDAKGFGGIAIDARGLPRSRQLEPVPPMLVRFALDSAEKTYILNSSNNLSFPGKGLLLSQIDTHKVFSTDPSWRKRGKDSPHWRWTEQSGLFTHSLFHNFNLEDFSEASFLFLRGVKAVIPSKSARYMLDDTPYSYLVYNRHFYPGVEVALGVPTEVLLGLVGPSLISAEDYKGFDPHRADLAHVDLSFQNLWQACAAKNLNLLDLTYGSVIGGGLCNAYLPEALPHYRWEREQKTDAGSAWTDAWGHIHKSFRLGHYSSSMKVELNRYLVGARELHHNVLDVFRSLQGHLTAVRFALSFYKMGSTKIAPHDFKQADPIEPDQQQQEAAEARNQENEEAEDQAAPQQADRPVHEYRYRMLEEAYRWHLGAREQGWNVGQVPVLHFAYVLDPNSLPQMGARKFQLDTATMILTTQDGSFQLPKNSDGRGEIERELWRKHVIPHFQNRSTGWEPRFLLRDGAFTINE